MLLADTLSRAFLEDQASVQTDLETVNAVAFLTIEQKGIEEIKEETDRHNIKIAQGHDFAWVARQ